jgi:ribonuclease D
MRKRVTQKAAELDIEPALLASKRELENLLLSSNGNSLPERFLGWRKNVITDELLSLMETR